METKTHPDRRYLVTIYPTVCVRYVIEADSAKAALDNAVDLWLQSADQLVPAGAEWAQDGGDDPEDGALVEQEEG